MILSIRGRGRSCWWSSPWVTQESGIRLFDAQAWALVHYLMFGEEGRNAARVDRFNRLLYEGTAEGAALEEAFGDMTPYYEGMRGYVRRQVFGYTRIPVSLEWRPEGFTTRVLPPGEAATLRGEFLVAMGRPVEAALVDSEGRRDEARAAYAKAVEADSKKSHVYYRLAQLEWAPSADKALLEKRAARLETARELDPANAYALSFLAEVRSSLERQEVRQFLDLAARSRP